MRCEQHPLPDALNMRDEGSGEKGGRGGVGGGAKNSSVNTWAPLPSEPSESHILFSACVPLPPLVLQQSAQRADFIHQFKKHSLRMQLSTLPEKPLFSLKTPSLRESEFVPPLEGDGNNERRS